jgi:hypothetical protein
LQRTSLTSEDHFADNIPVTMTSSEEITHLTEHQHQKSKLN